MKPRVLFLSPSIGQGAGGVADYSRYLAVELGSAGLECHLASWSEPKPAADGHSDNRARLFLGTPGATPAEKCRELAGYLQHHKIDWVSLQFVNYGFHPRGLAGSLGRALEPLAGICRWHVFFHELWLGEQQGASAYECCVGWLQRRQMLRMLERLSPAAVWTSIGYYQRRLAEQDVRSEVVPVFGNFPITEGREDEWLTGQVRELTGCSLQRDQICFAGIFGTVYPIWPFHRVIPALAKRAKSKGQTLVLVFFGKNRCGPESYARIQSMQDVTTLHPGELDPGRVDRVMRTMDVALTATPAAAVFKSGGTVAFLERGVPTIAIPGMLEGKQKPLIEEHPSLIIADDDLEKKLDSAGATGEPRLWLPAVAERYLKIFTGQVQ